MVASRARISSAAIYIPTVLPNGAHFFQKVDNGLWWLGKISASTTTAGVYLLRCFDDPGPMKLPLFLARYVRDFNGSCLGLLMPAITLI